MAQQYDFPPLLEETRNVATAVMQAIVGSKQYNPVKTSEYIEAIGSGVVAQLSAIYPNFKIIVSTVIVEKKGAGFHSDCAYHWDAATDGAISVR